MPSARQIRGHAMPREILHSLFGLDPSTPRSRMHQDARVYMCKRKLDNFLRASYFKYRQKSNHYNKYTNKNKREKSCPVDGYHKLNSAHEF